MPITTGRGRETKRSTRPDFGRSRQSRVNNSPIQPESTTQNSSKNSKVSDKSTASLVSSPKEILNGLINRVRGAKPKQGSLEERDLSTDDSEEDIYSSPTLGDHSRSQTRNRTQSASPTRKSSQSSVGSDKGSVNTIDEDPEAPCIKCGVVGYDSMIQCDFCVGWVCTPCAAFTEEQRKTIESLKWKCPACVDQYKVKNCRTVTNESATDVVTSGDHTNQLDRIENMVLAMSVTLASKADASSVNKIEEKLDARITMLEEAMKKLGSPQTPRANFAQVAMGGVDMSRTEGGRKPVVFSEIVREELAEQRDIETRKSNLVVYRVPEQDHDLGPAERKEQDKAVAQTMCDRVCEKKVQVVETIRLGRLTSDAQSRPLLIKVNSLSDKLAILSNAYKLKTSDNFKTFAVTPDLTLKQRKARKSVYDELKARRSAGEINIIIRKGVIVQQEQHPVASQENLEEDRLASPVPQQQPNSQNQ